MTLSEVVLAILFQRRRRFIRQPRGAELLEDNVIHPELAGGAARENAESEARQLGAVTGLESDGCIALTHSRVEHIEDAPYASVWGHKYTQQIELTIQFDCGGQSFSSLTPRPATLRSSFQRHRNTAAGRRRPLRSSLAHRPN